MMDYWNFFTLFLTLFLIIVSYLSGFYRGQTTVLNVVNRDRKEGLRRLEEMRKGVEEKLNESIKMAHEIDVAFGDIRPIGGNGGNVSE